MRRWGGGSYPFPEIRFVGVSDKFLKLTPFKGSTNDWSNALKTFKIIQNEKAADYSILSKKNYVFWEGQEFYKTSKNQEF